MGVSYWLDSHPVPDRSVPVGTSERYDTVVVGGGLTGLVTALLLQRAGRRTCLVEARSIGAVATGNTTAKVSLLQGRLLGAVREAHGDDMLRAYVEANLAAQAWLVSFLDAEGVVYQRRSAVTYVRDEDARADLDREHAAAVAAGLPVAWADTLELPYPVSAAISLADQVQIHPTRVLAALQDRFLATGGVVHAGVRVHDVDTGSDCTVRTSGEAIVGGDVVLATGVPILDRGGHPARVRAERSYALAFRVPGPVPQGMYLSLDSSTRSLRTVPTRAGDVLLVGGNGHVVGRCDSPRARVDDLVSWTLRHFPGAELTHSWSAQDYRPAGDLPLVGALPGTGGRVFSATGYHKWGMTNAVVAGMRVAGELGGDPPSWATVLDGASLRAEGVRALAFTSEVAAAAAGGWVAAEAHALPAKPPPEGCGVVGRMGLRPAARSTVDGRTRTVSAVCPHLGGVLAWNDAESSWDCPLHGSRFDADGAVLEGPATSGLTSLD